MKVTLHKYDDGSYGGAVVGFAYAAAPFTNKCEWYWRVWRGRDSLPFAHGRCRTLRECRQRIEENVS